MITNNNYSSCIVRWERWALIFESLYSHYNCDYFRCPKGDEDDTVADGGCDDNDIMYKQYLKDMETIDMVDKAPDAVLCGKNLSTIFDESFRWSDILYLCPDAKKAHYLIEKFPEVFERTIASIEKLDEVKDFISEEYLAYSRIIKDEFELCRRILDCYSRIEKDSDYEYQNLKTKFKELYSAVNAICIEDIQYSDFIKIIESGVSLQYERIEREHGEEDYYCIGGIGILPKVDHILSSWMVKLCIMDYHSHGIVPDIRFESKHIPSKPPINWVQQCRYEMSQKMPESTISETERGYLYSILNRPVFEELGTDKAIEEYFSVKDNKKRLNYYSIMENFCLRKNGKSLLPQLLTLVINETTYLENNIENYCELFSPFVEGGIEVLPDWDEEGNEIVGMRRKHAGLEARRENARNWKNEVYTFLHTYYEGTATVEECERYSENLAVGCGNELRICSLINGIEDKRELSDAVGFPVVTQADIRSFITECIERNYEVANSITAFIISNKGALDSTDTKDRAFKTALERNLVEEDGTIKSRKKKELVNMLISEGFIKLKKQGQSMILRNPKKYKVDKLNNNEAMEISQYLDFTSIEGVFNATREDLRKTFINENKYFDSIIMNLCNDVINSSGS